MQEMEGEALDLGQQMDRLDEMAMASIDTTNLDGWSETASVDAEDSESTPVRGNCSVHNLQLSAGPH